MDWTKQGAAVVSSVELTTGQHGKAVIVGPRENPKGAVIVLGGAGGGVMDAKPIDTVLDQLAPETIAEIICTQERVFGSAGLPKVQFP